MRNLALAGIAIALGALLDCAAPKGAAPPPGPSPAAPLGCFKGRTAGLGPLVGFIQPMGQETLIVELKWLPELNTKNRLEGDYVWLKAVYKF